MVNSYGKIDESIESICVLQGEARGGRQVPVARGLGTNGFVREMRKGLRASAVDASEAGGARCFDWWMDRCYW